jgi:hypothetical protein
MGNFLVLLNTTSSFRAAPLLKTLAKEYADPPCAAMTGDAALCLFVAGAESADTLHEFVRQNTKSVTSIAVVELGKQCHAPDKDAGVAAWLTAHLAAGSAGSSGARADKQKAAHIYLYKGHQLHCKPDYIGDRYTARLIVVNPAGKTVLKRGFPTMEGFITEADAVEHARLCGEDMVSGTED